MIAVVYRHTCIHTNMHTHRHTYTYIYVRSLGHSSEFGAWGLILITGSGGSMSWSYTKLYRCKHWHFWKTLNQHRQHPNFSSLPRLTRSKPKTLRTCHVVAIYRKKPGSLLVRCIHLETLMKPNEYWLAYWVLCTPQNLNTYPQAHSVCLTGLVRGLQWCCSGSPVALNPTSKQFWPTSPNKYAKGAKYRTSRMCFDCRNCYDGEVSPITVSTVGPGTLRGNVQANSRTLPGSLLRGSIYYRSLAEPFKDPFEGAFWTL